MGMGYFVTIRKNDVGEERTFEYPYDWGESDEYMWADGNYACDDNRAQFFAEAGGEPDPDIECSDYKYTITKIVSDGKVVYTEV
jgi:hypothetical protein